MILRRAGLLPSLALALSIGLAGDAPERVRVLIQLVPELDPQMAGHLVRDTEKQFRAYCREIGPVRTFTTVAWLNGNVRTDSRESYTRSMGQLYPYVRRAADALSYEFDRPEYARIYQFRASLAESSWAHRQCISALDSLQWDATSSLSKKLERYSLLATRFANFGDEREIMDIEAALALEAARAGRDELQLPLLRSALARARRLCEHHQVCQILGDMGDAYGHMGRRDSALACYREGIALADRRFILDQATRLRRFLSAYYREEGRLVASSALLQEALAVNRRYGGDPLDIRALIKATEFYEQLQCWDMVERNTQRFPVLLRGLRHSKYVYEAGQYGFTVRRLNAMVLAAKGRASEAADSLGRLLADARPTAKPDQLVPIVRQHAEVLLRAGRAREALAAAEAGVEFAGDQNFRAERRALALVLARAAVSEHHLDVARRALALATEVDPQAPWLGPESADVVNGIAASIALEAGDEREAHRLVRRGLEGLRDSIRLLDRGPQTDLTVGAAEDLWLAGHRLLANDAGEDLAFERHWRSLASDAREPGRHAGAEPERVTVPARTIQLVYAVMPEGIVRWTARAGGVRRDVLALDPGECRDLVERVFEEASRDPRDPTAAMPETLISLARRLGAALLPDDVRDGRYDRVSISAEGPLGRLPFELLHASAGSEYVPLLSCSEVRYIRHVRRRPQRTRNETSVILADARGSASRRGSRGSLVPLAGVETEIARALDILPHARVIRGNMVSKSALLREWGSASAVYVAAHLVRDPDAPLFNYFPIPFGGGSGVSADEYLDLRDVRDTDLSRCRLVVLSSCASGEPYVAGTRSGPSMADAFLDAGAEAVVHTRWRVRDESAAATAPRLTAAWLAGGDTPWLVARRALIHGPRGIRHPFEWAAWSVTTALPVPVWTGTAGALSVAR